MESFIHANFWEMILRTTLSFFILLILARILGKKQLGQLTFFHYITGITFGSIAAEIASQEETPFLDGIISLVWWSALTYLMTIITIKSKKARVLIDDKPTIASMDRMFDLMDEPYEVKNKVGARELPAATGEVRFDNVSFQYEKDGVSILKNINFTINPGETVAFVGMSGGGKSTIISLIPRFYDATDGFVTIDGQDVRDVTLHSLRSQIGIVLQDNILFSDSVKENILMGKPDATDEQVIEAAKAANAHDFIMTLPNGYDTKVGERGVKLSGGQKQRVAIARVFLKNPPILILDEATSALDLESEALIQESLDELAHERTTIIIAHRLSTITHADKIFVIDHGQLIESGTHEQLMMEQGTYYDLFQVQHLE